MKITLNMFATFFSNCNYNYYRKEEQSRREEAMSETFGDFVSDDIQPLSSHIQPVISNSNIRNQETFL